MPKVLTKVQALATQKAGGELKAFEYELPELPANHVDIKVLYCGICHSDLSMLDNEWFMTQFPFVPGHEIAGIVQAVGSNVTHLKPGQKVGLGWFSESCMVCSECMSGDHNLCIKNEGTIVARHGGFAETVRCHSSWALALPDELDLKSAGPLLCGGITVFNPIVQFNVKPTDRVAVLGIGGLGHLALQFLNKWGCEVTAFTSSEAKAQEAKNLGAHHIVNSADQDALSNLTGNFNFILNTANADFNWAALINTLAPKGRLHTVGAVPNPISVPAFPLLLGQKSISGSPLGSPATTSKMLEFCTRHNIKPVSQHFKMSQANEAIELLRSGKARYRLVLEADFN